MNSANIYAAREWFEVLQTSDLAQTAVMTLQPGKSSSEEPNRHDDSEQILLVVEGEAQAEIRGQTATLRRGDVVLIPANTPHKFTNTGTTDCVTFNVYVPPEYPPGEKG